MCLGSVTSVIRRRRYVLLVLAVLPLTVLLVATTPGVSVAANSNAVSITRDSDGIPHIRAANFTALGYGEAWAFSQDNFCTLAQDFVTVEGLRSKYFGPDNLSVNYSAGVESSNFQSDLFWQSIRTSGLANQAIHAAPPIGPLPQVLQVYEGFVAGYNAYLASGNLHDPRCVGRPWVRPITLTDMILRGVQIITEAGSEQFVADEVDADPPTSSDSESFAGTPDSASLVADFDGEADASTGSNAIAIGSQDTADGNGMVLANPHFPWRGTERFWMAQMTVPGQYNVEGGTLEGFPLIGIGFNEHLAWTHTVSTSFRFTFYQLALVPGDPTSYYVDGVPYKMGKKTVRVSTGRHRTVTHTFYTTRWGRVLVVPQAGYKWTDSTAYAVDDSTLDEAFRGPDQYFRMGQATSVTGLLAVESQYLAVPTFNTIAADDTGHVLYGDVGNTPNVPQSLITSCMPSGAAQVVYRAAGVVTLDGSRSACAWLNDPGTPVPGIFDANHMPHTLRTDYVENSNDSYWLANPSAPFPAYSPIIGHVDVAQGLRTRMGNQMIAARIAGTDGLGPPKFTIATLQEMWESDQSLLAQLVLAPLVSACQKTPTAKASNGTVVDLGPACQALAGYNGTGALDAHGGWLFSEWASLAPIGQLWTTTFNPQQPLTTPSGLDVSNPAVLQSLADAILNLEAHHVPLDASYGQVQHATRNGAKIPIPGCDTGCFNAIYPNTGSTNPVVADPYGEVYAGSSLVMTTELTPHGPVSQGILTYSQATDPTSPWYANMTRLYSEGRWVSLPYTSAQLARDRGARTVTLNAT
jgi:acyl-homoserine-lactone acylase